MTSEDVCPTCGMDVPRAAMVTVVALFYKPRFECPRCPFRTSTMQDAVDHMAEQHEPDVAAYLERVLR